MVTTENNKLKLGRYFTGDIQGSVYDSFNWEKTNIDITDDNGALMFKQKDVKFPSEWSHLARKIVGSKYFYGQQGTDERESGADQLISRVTDKFRDWAEASGYFSSQEDLDIFRDELAHLALGQRASFNSPVWFNVGTDQYVKERSKDQKQAYVPYNGKIIKVPKGRDREYPQTSACFIQSVDDTMEDIMQLAVNEAMLFKYGSGTGSDLSTLRSSQERLSGGGKPSGPLAYWKFYDVVAGIVKSGGKTRRAAKMDSLKDWHPDIMDFIRSKTREEEKARMLQDAGVESTEASETVAYQNTNISVRLSDEFMQAYLKDDDWQTRPVHNQELAEKMPKYKAREMLRAIAEGTHFCGDPGVQFDTTINKWHTCKDSGDINASNPCSEYMFLDDSSCNLASLNLKSFMREEGDFDIPSFEKAVKLTAIAQDLEFDHSSFPTKDIARNSYEYRPLGMGYANLGSIIMEKGLAYDSAEARAIAASITALQTGLVYKTSTELAEKLGTFKHYERNKESMLEVISMHKDALKKIDREKLPEEFHEVLDKAEKVWTTTLRRGKKYGFRNAQATVLAPTGTIGFMMDCDTKGVEPEIGLVQRKLLSDGGVLRLINSSVEPALRKLGYDDEQIGEIIHYVSGHTDLRGAPELREEDMEEFEKTNLLKKTKFLKDKGYSEDQIRKIKAYALGNETMEGAPHIKEEHLPVFDCSNKPSNFTRTISTRGHLEMMAAVQPFLSGAISKTVNMPHEATVEEIEQAYVDSWRLGLKAVAIYRDGSKIYQPLNFDERSLEAAVEQGPIRNKLPITRESVTHKFAIGDFEKPHEGYMTLGMYPQGGVGEMFANMSKEGSTVSGLLDGIATVTSLALQYGVPLEKIAQKFKNAKFTPNGLVVEGREDMKTANSITEYIFEAADRFDKERKQALKEGRAGNFSNGSVEDYIKEEGEIQEELGGFCPVCSTQMLKKGHCNEVCPQGCHEDNKGCGTK